MNINQLFLCVNGLGAHDIFLKPYSNTVPTAYVGIRLEVCTVPTAYVGIRLESVKKNIHVCMRPTWQFFANLLCYIGSEY